MAGVVVMKCLRAVMIMFNSLFMIIGAVFLVAGAAIAVIMNSEYTHNEALSLGIYVNIISVVYIAAIVIGALAFLLSFFGWLGALKMQRVILISYAVLMALLIIAQISLGIAAVVAKETAEKHLEEKLLEGIENYKEVSSRSEVQNPIDVLQKMLGCCGANNPDNWNETFEHGTKPGSCCNKPANETCTTKDKHDVFVVSCLTTIFELFQGSTLQVMATSLAVLGVIEIGGVIVASILAKFSNQDAYKEV